LYTGLVANELIVNAQPEELSYLGADVRPAFTPIIDAASIVATDRRRPFGTTRHKRFLEDKGFKPRGPIEYLTICVSHEVRRQAQCFATEATVETELALLEKSRPDLVTAAAREMAPGRLARLLRKLLREEISIRDLVGVLDRLLTYDSVAADTLNHNIFDYRLPIHPKLKLRSRDDEDNLTQYVRSGLKRAITFKNLRGSNTIDVYLLHSEIESSLLDHLAALNGVEDAVVLNAERLDQIQAAIRREAERTALGSWTPAILTSTNIRSFVRSLVADEFPGMSVLSYDELDLGPDYFIQVIAVISIP
jgi:type III secretion protein V